MSASAGVETPINAASADAAPPTVPVLIVCPVVLYRDGIAHGLRREPAIEVVGTARGPEEAVPRLAEHGPAVVLLDASIPGKADLVRRMLATASGTTVLALALAEDERQVLACAEAGMAGYIPPHASLDELVAAVRAAARGEARCSPRITGCLVRRLATLARERRGYPGLDALTRREREVLELLAEGLSNKAIARRLGIGVATVKNHVHMVLEKLGVKRRHVAAARARELLGIPG